MSVTRTGARSPILGSLVTLLVAAVWWAPAPADEPPLAGTVRDAVGGLLSGVEILFVLSSADTFVPTAVVQSDKAGRFRVDRLSPGRYRYAALKHGYQTLVGQVDTVVEDSIHLVLRPAEAVDDQDLPNDASWALRLPRRGMLNDTEPLLVPDDEFGSPVERSSLDDSLHMEVEQYFSISSAAAESRSEDTEIRPSETRMRLASAIGERGNIRVEGRSERLTAESQRGATPSSFSGWASCSRSPASGTRSALLMQTYSSRSASSGANASSSPRIAR